MERLAKLEEKTQSKPEVYDDDFNKILMEIHENDDMYLDDDGDPVPQLVMKSPIIAPIMMIERNEYGNRHDPRALDADKR
ncbi:unnamed protein product [Rhizophagus irregularis]|nr:unnamed protein product [Rhizophagus irregularis]